MNRLMVSQLLKSEKINGCSGGKIHRCVVLLAICGHT